jgi:2-dehydro-3-deoxyphosphogluconate aldolase/(4S)-4-hydroxy-2-oxoglutarate aldolase
MSICEELFTTRLVPVIRTKTAEQASKLVEIFQQQGVKVVELTLTTPGATEVIAKWSKQLTVGAGTVTTREQAQAATKAGAKFLVSPGFSQSVCDFAKETKTFYIPGVLTPTEVIAAQAQGLTMFKLFPAGAIGGEKYLNALMRVFPQAEWMVTGGVNLDTMAGYLKAGAVLGVGESMMSDELMERGEWNKVETQIREYYQKLKALTAK